MYPIPQIRSPTEPVILVHNPDGAFRRIETLSPRNDCTIQVLDLGVVAAEAHGDDLRDLDG